MVGLYLQYRSTHIGINACGFHGRRPEQVGSLFFMLWTWRVMCEHVYISYIVWPFVAMLLLYYTSIVFHVWLWRGMRYSLIHDLCISLCRLWGVHWIWRIFLVLSWDAADALLLSILNTHLAFAQMRGTYSTMLQLILDPTSAGIRFIPSSIVSCSLRTNKTEVKKPPSITPNANHAEWLHGGFW